MLTESDTAPGDVGAGSARVLRVIEMIAGAQRPPTHTELAAALGIAKSTLSRVLSAMRREGYVEIVEKRYVPGPQLLAVAHKLSPFAVRDERLRRQVRPFLESLAVDTGETVALSVEVGAVPGRPGTVLAVDYVESPNLIRFVPGIGAPQPMYRTAAGRVFLAFSNRSLNLNPSERESWRRGDMPASATSIEAELAEVRRRGYALNMSSVRDVVVMAAPILDDEGWPIAVISVFGPEFRILDPRETIWPYLKAAIARATMAVD